MMMMVMMTRSTMLPLLFFIAYYFLPIFNIFLLRSHFSFFFGPFVAFNFIFIRCLTFLPRLTFLSLFRFRRFRFFAIFFSFITYLFLAIPLFLFFCVFNFFIPLFGRSKFFISFMSVRFIRGFACFCFSTATFIFM